MVTGNLKDMSPEYLRAATMTGYGVTLYVGLGVPLPVLTLTWCGPRRSGMGISWST